MPHFCRECGADEYICQNCGSICCVKCSGAPEWKPDITGHKEAGNVCPRCVRFIADCKRDNELCSCGHARREHVVYGSCCASSSPWASRGSCSCPAFKAVQS